MGFKTTVNRGEAASLPILILRKHHEEVSTKPMKSAARHYYNLMFCLIAFGALSGCGSPQKAPMTTTLTGQCIGLVQNSNQCGSVQDLTGCPAGQAAIKPTYTSYCS